MRRLYSFFVCLFVFAACSTMSYHKEQVARTFAQEATVDSASFRHMIDLVVQDELRKQVDISEWVRQTIVKEILSAPDSTGAQHVTERTITTQERQSETSACISQKKGEKILEQSDSISYHAKDSVFLNEKEKVFDKHIKNRIPWYVYVIAVLVAVMAIGLVILKKRGFKII